MCYEIYKYFSYEIMASTSSNINLDFDDEENNISVYKCIFCNAHLDGNSKILECLHIACNNCILEKTIDSSKLILVFY